MAAETGTFRVIISAKNGVSPSITDHTLQLQQYQNLVPFNNSEGFSEVCVESLLLTYFQATNNPVSLGTNIVTVCINPFLQNTVDNTNGYNLSNIVSSFMLTTTAFSTGVLQSVNYYNSGESWAEIDDHSFNGPLRIQLLTGQKKPLGCQPDEIVLTLRFRFTQK